MSRATKLFELPHDASYRAIHSDDPTTPRAKFVAVLSTFVVEGATGVIHHGPWDDRGSAVRFADSMPRLADKGGALCARVIESEPYWYVYGYGKVESTRKEGR